MARIGEVIAIVPYIYKEGEVKVALDNGVLIQETVRPWDDGPMGTVVRSMVQRFELA